MRHTFFSLQDDSESLNLSTSSLLRSCRSYNKWSLIEEGVTLAWKDVNVYIRTTNKGEHRYKQIINGGKTLLILLLRARCFYLFAHSQLQSTLTLF